MAQISINIPLGKCYKKVVLRNWTSFCCKSLFVFSSHDYICKNPNIEKNHLCRICPIEFFGVANQKVNLPIKNLLMQNNILPT
jgi:hypothetical protein